MRDLITSVVNVTEKKFWIALVETDSKRAAILLCRSIIYVFALLFIKLHWNTHKPDSCCVTNDRHKPIASVMQSSCSLWPFCSTSKINLCLIVFPTYRFNARLVLVLFSFFEEFHQDCVVFPKVDLPIVCRRLGVAKTVVVSCHYQLKSSFIFIKKCSNQMPTIYWRWCLLEKSNFKYIL